MAASNQIAIRPACGGPARVRQSVCEGSGNSCDAAKRYPRAIALPTVEVKGYHACGTAPLQPQAVR